MLKQLPTDWMVKKLGDVVDIISGYAFKTTDFKNVGVPVIKIKNIVSPYVTLEDVQYVDYELFESKSKYQLFFNDILISLTGSNVNQFASAVGKVGRVKLKCPQLLLNQRVGKFIITDKNSIDYNFLYYHIIQSEIRYYLAKNAGGAANQANISPSDVKNLVINLPPLEKQKKIADILSCLDDKIEVNQQISKKLDEITQIIFKQWIIDFNFPDENGTPYKDSGGAMIDSEFGEIPKGWQIKNLDEVATFTNGLAMQKYRPKDNELSLPVIKIKELRQGYVDDSSDRCSYNIANTYKLANGDVVFSWSGTLLVDIWCGGMGGLNQHLFKITSDSYPKWFYYYWTKHHLEYFIGVAQDKATTMGHIQRKHLSSAKVLIPDAIQLKKLNAIISPIVDYFVNTCVESKKLENIRDSLLPKLMSGEIDVTHGV